MRVWIFIITLVFLCSSLCFAVPIINEVSPLSPEWVEIYNNDSSILNLSQWLIIDNSSDNPDEITCYDMQNCSLITNVTYIIILGRSTNVSDFFTDPNNSVVYYTDDSRIGNGLNDGSDIITFFNSSYNTSFGYNSTRTERSWSWNGTDWLICLPTPGYGNNCSSMLDEIPVDDDLCNISVVIDSDDIYDIMNSSSIKYRINISDYGYHGFKHNISVYYWIEDLFGNIVRDLYVSNVSLDDGISLSRSWTPDDMIGTEAYIIKVNITASCNDSSLDDNQVYEIFTVKGFPPFSGISESSINMTDISQGSDGSTKWGERFDVSVSIHRGNISKYAVYFYVKDPEGTKVSEESVIHMKKKNSDGVFRVPVQLKTYCKGEHPDGDYNLIIEGLGIIQISSIKISGYNSNTCKSVSQSCPVCRSISSTSKTKNSEQDLQEDYTDEDLPIQDNTVFNDYDIAFYPSGVNTNQKFDVGVSIYNRGNRTSRLILYSYVQDGGALISSGLSWDGWKKVWDANKKIIFVKPNSSEIVVLTNVINNTLPTENYSLKVKIKDVDRTVTLDREIKLITNMTYDNMFRYNISCKPSSDGVRILSRSFLNSTLFIFSENNTRITTLEPDKELIVSDGYYFIVLKPDSIISTCFVSGNVDRLPDEEDNHITGSFFGSLFRGVFGE
ncbi:MAG: hypothetical protein ABIA21_01830 [Candidatus Aenigmatarchaeota archaeon]